MKIGYFTATDITISETFIYSLIRGLESKCQENQFIHFTGNKKGKAISKNTLFTHFRINNRFTKTIDELEERFGLKTNLTIRIKHAWVKYKLGNLKKEDFPNVAYVDYGQTSILLHKFFTDNSIPFVVHFHGYDANQAFNSSMYTREISKVFNKANYIIVASYFLKRLLVLKGCPPEKVQIVRYGIDVGNMKPIPWADKIKNDPSIVFLGRLTEKKNPIALIYAFNVVKKKVPNAKLTIIGDGKLKDEVLKTINLLNLSNDVKLLGSLPQEMAHLELKRHWIYAQHSVTATNGDQEGCAISPGEAAAYELPVVSTIHNGIPEYVVDGKTGYLVREFDYVTMGNKIVDIINNVEMAVKMGKEGRAIIAQLNDPKLRIDTIFNYIERACINKN